MGRFLGAITLALNFLVVWKLGLIIRLLQIPAEIQGLMRDYLWIIFMGMVATFLYNYFANLFWGSDPTRGYRLSIDSIAYKE